MHTTSAEPVVISVVALLLGCVLKGAAAQAPLPNTMEMVRQSDFVGFVQAAPQVSNPRDEWRQGIFLYRVDPLKGSLARDPAMNNQFPWVFADHATSSGYPTWFSDKGEYLVFLRRRARRGREVWTTTAAFRVEYRPATAGRIVGTVIGDKKSRQVMSTATARALLERVAANRSAAPDAAWPLDRLFQSAAASSGGFLSRRKPVPHEKRLREAQQLAAAIKPGTTRAAIEKVFPQQDGGISGPSSTRYYLGSEVMVEVPYDQTGGAWKPQNQVNGPVQVYRSLVHYD